MITDEKYDQLEDAEDLIVNIKIPIDTYKIVKREALKNKNIN